jgi:hypothetical protein
MLIVVNIGSSQNKKQTGERYFFKNNQQKTHDIQSQAHCDPAHVGARRQTNGVFAAKLPSESLRRGIFYHGVFA